MSQLNIITKYIWYYKALKNFSMCPCAMKPACLCINAGIGHGVRRSMVSLGSVLGCLWGAIALQLSSTTLQFGGPVGLIVLSIVSFFTPTI